MAVQVECESCGGTDTVAAARDALCRGCGRTLCQSCVDVFDHLGDGAHGIGDPEARVRTLEAQLAELRGAASRGRELVRQGWDDLPEDVCTLIYELEANADPASHVRDALAAKQNAAALAAQLAEREARVAELEEALREALERLGGKHQGHFDMTGQSGLGCPVCIDERETKKRLRRAFYPQPPSAEEGDER